MPLPRLRLGLIGLFATVAIASAQTSVWKVTRGENSLYLGGTIHLLRPADFPLPPEFDAAFRASARIVFETDVGRVQSPEMHNVIATQGMFTDGATLRSVLTPRAWKIVTRYCNKAGLPLDQVSQMKPWLFTVMLAAMEMQKIGVTSEGVDVHYFKQATKQGKATGELETFEEHVAFITQLGAGHESEMVAKSIEDLDEVPSMIAKLIGAWRAGNIERVEELLIRDMRQKYPSIFQELLVNRNNAWLPKIEALAGTEEVEFVLVGAGHLAGREGLLEQLRARGYTVEQVEAPRT